jgi:hypothetical protein
VSSRPFSHLEKEHARVDPHCETHFDASSLPGGSLQREFSPAVAFGSVFLSAAAGHHSQGGVRKAGSQCEVSREKEKKLRSFWSRENRRERESRSALF